MTNINSTEVNFKQRYEHALTAVNKVMEGYLVHDPGVPDILRQAMLYSLRAGGKRLRPVMVILACEACGGEEIVALPAAAAMEMIHTYSLIHDDLPAMDDDDLRRGQPTSHKVFGDGIAILAGDALLTYAFHTLALHVHKDYLVSPLVKELSEAAGAAGMIGGQVADLNSHKSLGDLNAVKYIHTHKTAMMFRAAARMGAFCAEADNRTIGMLGDYGLKIGLAFQIIDDLLDVTSNTREMGKQTQKDQDSGKLTYPSVMGVEESSRHAEQLLADAKNAIVKLGPDGEFLVHLADTLIHRKN